MIFLLFAIAVTFQQIVCKVTSVFNVTFNHQIAVLIVAIKVFGIMQSQQDFFIQGESGNAQPPPTGAVATVPYYAQPTPVNIVSRPQMVIPVTGQPPFHAGTRPTIVHSTAIPTQIPWQPAAVQYQEVRPAAFQPVMHYGAVPQTSSGGPGQAAYAVATGAGVHYVRGVKDIQGQGGVAKYNHNGTFSSYVQRRTGSLLVEEKLWNNFPFYYQNGQIHKAL